MKKRKGRLVLRPDKKPTAFDNALPKAVVPQFEGGGAMKNTSSAIARPTARQPLPHLVLLRLQVPAQLGVQHHQEAQAI